MELDHTEEERKQMASCAAFHFPVPDLTGMGLMLASSLFTDCFTRLTKSREKLLLFSVYFFKRIVSNFALRIFFDVTPESCGFKRGQRD